MLFTAPLLLLAAGVVNAHMRLYEPPPFKAPNNPHTQQPDHQIHFPYNCCGKKTPLICRGYTDLIGTPEGASVAKWAAGSEQIWSIEGPPPEGGNHYGGSCQIGFSIDGGKTFRTTVSYEGNCPHRNGGLSHERQRFPFTVPKDLPNGDAIFAWTWVNREQEFFMNCAVVTITDASGQGTAPASSSSGSGSSGSSPAAPASAPPASPDTDDTSSHEDSFPHDAIQPGQISSCSEGCECSPRRWWDRYTNPTCYRCCHPYGRDPYSNGGSQKSKRSVEKSLPLLDVSMKARRAPGAKAQRLMPRDVSFMSRPEMLFLDVGNGCLSPKTTRELKYPNPGPDVVEGDGEYPVELPSGNC